MCVCVCVFYIHGSVHCESNLINVQQDATVFSLLYFCRQLYMFWVFTPIIRSSCNCNYSFWHWSTGLLPSALVVEFQLNSTTKADGSRPG